MKKVCTILALFTAACAVSCSSVEYNQRGRDFPPLHQTEKVDVIMKGSPDYKVMNIGIAKVYGPLEDAMEELKTVCRMNGANVAIFKGSKNMSAELKYREFVLARRVIERAVEKPAEIK